MYLKIKTIINSKNAISKSDGEKFHLVLNRQFKLNNILSEKDIVVDFEGVEIVTNPFMRASIFTFLQKNKEAIDSIEFIDSSKEDGKVNEFIKLHLDRLIPLALDDELFKLHNQYIEDAIKYG